MNKIVPVHVVRNAHKQLRKDYQEYKKTNGEVTLSEYITNVLNYDSSEAKKIIKNGNRLLKKV